MDIVKIQYELVVPHIDIEKPEDWKKGSVYDKEFDNFILGADCIVPSGTDYARLREIIDYAHHWRKTHRK